MPCFTRSKRGETRATRRILSILVVTVCVSLGVSGTAPAQPEILLLQQQHVWQVERDRRGEIARQQERIRAELLRDLRRTGRDDASLGSQMTCLPECVWLRLRISPPKSGDRAAR